MRQKDLRFLVPLVNLQRGDKALQAYAPFLLHTDLRDLREADAARFLREIVDLRLTLAILYYLKRKRTISLQIVAYYCNYFGTHMAPKNAKTIKLTSHGHSH